MESDYYLGLLICGIPYIVISEIFYIWLGIQVMKGKNKPKWVAIVIPAIFGLFGIIILAIMYREKQQQGATISKSGSISNRINRVSIIMQEIINESEIKFVIPTSKNRFVDGSVFSLKTIKEDLGKFLFGLRGQSVAWRTGRFQGQAVEKYQLLSGFEPLLRDWDKLMNAWTIYGIEGVGMDELKKLYEEVRTISFDANESPFPK
jgi:hypothetical protein